MARILFESRDRNEAHRYQARVIADRSAPRAACTDHEDRGTTVVWDGNIQAGDLDILATIARPK
jgi:hypothetical protein